MKIGLFFGTFNPIHIGHLIIANYMIEFSDLDTCKQKAHYLQDAGFAVKAILPPTVPAGSQRLRICIHAFNTPEEIDRLIALLEL